MASLPVGAHARGASTANGLLAPTGCSGTACQAKLLASTGSLITSLLYLSEETAWRYVRPGQKPQGKQVGV